MPDLAPRTIEDKRARLRRLRRATARARLLACVLLTIELLVLLAFLLNWVDT